MEQCHDVHLKIGLEHGRIDFEERTPRAADRVVHDDLGVAGLTHGVCERVRVGDVARQRHRIGKFACQRIQSSRVARDERGAIARGGEMPRHRSSCSRSDAGDDRERLHA
jgi:hypothetical protein